MMIIDIDHEQQLRERGRAHGYKACCIDFFCGPWIRKIDTRMRLDALTDRLVNQIYAALAKWAGFKPGHIPCPDCLGEKLRKKYTRTK